MDPAKPVRFGRADFDVTRVGFGAAPIGNFLRPIAEDDASGMVHAAWNAGLRYFDTAPSYGHGLSEARLGAALRWYPRDEFVVSTKVGRVLKARPRREIDFSPWVDGLPFEPVVDYSYDGVMRAFEDSLQRLGLGTIDIAFIHDCDVFTHGPERQPGLFEEAMEGAWRALNRLRAEGSVKAIGLGVNEWEVCHEALKRRDFDCFLLAGRYTLLEQGALDAFLPLCEQRNVAVVLGGGFNGGILATGAVPGAKYNYKPAPAAIMTRTAAIEAVCRAHDVPLKAAALQFVLAHPAIVTTIPGTRSLAQLAENLGLVHTEIPADFWTDLKSKGLLHPEAPVPTDEDGA